jgi:aminopeptidase YwaD
MMVMREYLKRIASSNQDVRRNELLAMLSAIGCPFTLHREQIAGCQPKNVVVSFHGHEQQPRLVVGAHYDSVSGSTGANDNGAAVCVLLTLLQTYVHQPPQIPLDIVFFDLEEQGHLGSLAYIERSTAREILAMINLDICGVGNTLLCAPDRHARTDPFAQPLQKTLQKSSLPCYILPTLPSGDDYSFEKAGIPNLSLCMVPDSDIAVMMAAMNAVNKGKQPQKRPAILETFHNGSRDALDTVEDEAMQHVLCWIGDLIQCFDACFSATYAVVNNTNEVGG